VSGVHTVLGVVDPADVGLCLPHEHLRCDFSPVTGDLDHVLNDVDLVVEELTALARAGGRTVVDVTPPDLGRDPLALCEIARRSGLHVVMGTGWYRRAFYPPHLDTTATQALAEEMVAELTEGVGGVRAGIIGEIGVDRDAVSAVEERVLRAAARASVRTGAPVTTHASMYPVGLAQLDLLAEEGADPARVVIGHADTYLDPDYHRAVLRRGAYLQFDTAGREHMNPDRRRARALAALVREGWSERLLLSSDRCFRSDLVAFGGVGYAHVPTGFRALLAAEGVGDEEFALLTEANPRRVLTW
jgi:phosphotriesterase-related protein